MTSPPPSDATTPGRRRRLLWSLAGFLALVGFGTTLAVGLRTNGQDTNPASPDPLTETRDAPAPPLAGTTLDGKRFDLADLPHQVVLVNVWASWCDPCRAELPLLVQAQKRWSNRGLHVVGVDIRDAAGAARQMLTEAGASGLTAVTDPQGTTAVAWGVRGVPETFLLDRDHRIRICTRGAITADWLAMHLPPLLGS
jgi:cytochrome c biogenesis protein CcmG/thiol:disulfide interchange protein DsbE